MQTAHLRFLPPALRSRNYRLFFAGQSISLIGTWMTQIATVWLVYHITNSALMLGVVGFTSQIPNLLLTPFGGVFADRFSPHRILIGTQLLAMLQSLSLAALALSGVIQLWHILALSLFQGIISAIDAPARQVFVTELVDRREDLANAIAINSTMFNAARLIGPAIGGLLIIQIGEAYCFLIDGISYIAVIAALLAMRLKPKQMSVMNGNPLQIIKEGFDYAFNSPPIRTILLISSLVSLMGTQYTVLIPVFADKILNGNAQTLGMLMAASGIGALAGAIYLVTKTTVIGLGRLMTIGPGILGIGLIVLALSRFLPLSLLAMLPIGLGTIFQMAAGNTVLQTIVDDDKRGRVMSLYSVSFLGITPFGSLFGGALGDLIGATNTLIIAGITCILGSLFFRKQLRALKTIVYDLYHQKGVDIGR
jgi:MFS family permease